MKYIPYNKMMGSVELTTLTFKVAKALGETHFYLAVEFLQAHTDLSKETAAAVLRSIANIDECAFQCIVDWVVPAELEMTEGEYWLIRQLYTLPTPQKVMAIKFLREQYPMRLREAKDICDYIGAQK